MNPSLPVSDISVVCRKCGTRFEERQESGPRRVACPQCEAPVTVPAAASAKEPDADSPFLPEGGYRLERGDQTVEGRRTREERVATVICPICRARLQYEARHDARQEACPDCFEAVRVPSLDEFRAARERQKASIAPEIVETLSLSPTDLPRRRPSSRYLDVQSAIRREPDASLPRSLFFSGTLTFPWQREVISRWAYLSIGLTVCALLVEVMQHIYEQSSGYSGVTLAFIALPGIWIVLWTASYAAAVGLECAIDTANGNDRIVHWGEQNWREWIPRLVYVQYLTGIAAAAAHGIAWGSQRLGAEYRQAFIPAFVVLFPLVVVSALEQGSALNFFSKGVLATVVRRPLVWFGFLLWSALLVGGWMWAVLALMPAAPVAAGVLAGVGGAAVILIYARLLGRLALGISTE